MTKKSETLQPGDAGYEAAFHAAPLLSKDGSIARLKSPIDAQREADEANNKAVADAAKSVAKTPATDKKASQ